MSIYGNFLEEATREDLNTKYLEKKDGVYNLDKWSVDDCNVLFITGLAGSGKTTLATDIKNNVDCYRVELDYLLAYYIEDTKEKDNYKKLYGLVKRECPEAAEFIDKHPADDKTIFKTWDQSNKMCKEFVTWFMKEVKGKKNLYIINGVQIVRTFDASYFYDKPIIFKNVTVLQTAARRLKRDFSRPSLKIFMNAYRSMRSIFNKKFLESHKQFNKYRDDIEKNSNKKEEK
jgi:uridine kinase